MGTRWRLRVGLAPGEQRLPLLVTGYLLLTLALALIAPSVLSPYQHYVLTQILILGIFALGFDLVFGIAGLPSLGHAAFFGLGGYITALGATRWRLDWSLNVLLTVVLCAALGLLFMLLAARTRGVYFLLMTLAMGQALWGLASKWTSFSGGDNGITGVSKPVVFGIATVQRGAFYNLVLAVFLLVLALLAILMLSPVGRVLAGSRESESRMAALGYNVLLYRLAAFAVSGAVSGLAGALMVYSSGFVSPASLNWTQSADVMVMAILGGAGTLIGPVLGAGIVTAVQSFAGGYTEHTTLVLGIIFVLTSLFARAGLVRLLARGGRRPHRLPDVDHELKREAWPR